jgi:hypothetical protein
MSSSPRTLFSINHLFALSLALIFALGLGVRFFDLSAPLLDFHPTRQLFAAIRARGIYYETLSNVPAWQKDLATRQLENTATIEPPIMENVAAFLYGYFGEQTAIPRMFSVIFWAMGGIFLFLLACNLTGSSPGAAAALAVYMFIPYALRASRAFQPDPMMVALIILFWWAVENWGRKPASWKWTLLAGVSGGLAIFVKFPAAFFVIGGALGAIFAHASLRKIIKLPQTWSMMLLGILPAGLYLYYGLYVARFLGQQFEDRFYPEMLISPNFYLRWFLKTDQVVGVLWLALALLGCLLFASRPMRIFLISVFVSYIAFGLFFDYHISSHDYYSLPLIPIVALGFAPLAADVSARLREKLTASRFLSVATCLVFLLTFTGLTVTQYLDLRTHDYRADAAFWVKVGEAMNHQPGVIAVIADYGYPLEYYGWQNSEPWPLVGDIRNFERAFPTLTGKKSYFLVTDFDQFNLQPNLRKRLQSGYPVLVRGTGYIAYDLLHPLKLSPVRK